MDNVDGQSTDDLRCSGDDDDHRFFFFFFFRVGRTTARVHYNRRASGGDSDAGDARILYAAAVA